MTDREKRIEEVKDCSEWATIAAIVYDDKTQYPNRAARICDYIKEVRKEMAKEILQEIASPYYSVGDVYELTRHDIQELAEKFGAEVEE